jgi:hypothetical protein
MMVTRPSPRKILLLSFIILLILLTKPLYAIKTGTLQKSDLTFIFEEGLNHTAEKAVELYPGLKAELERVIGWKIAFRSTVMLIKDNIVFQRMAGNNLIVAFAVPDRDLIVIDHSKMKTDPFTIEAILKHELCHLLLHNYIKRETLPKWLDEGIAQWVSGGLADIIMKQKNSVLDEAILGNRLIGIRALADRFPGEEKHLKLAYAESKSLTEYIISEYGLNGILTVLEYLKDGDNIDSAVSKALSVSFDELEGRWYNSLKKRITWFTFLSNNLYEILFFLAALALIYGFIRVLLKKRAYIDSEEEDNGQFR